MYCPKCKSALPDGSVACDICGWELSTDEQSEWGVVGTVEQQVFADLARETLNSQDIPNVVVSKGGFFGSVGLNFNPLFDSRKPWVFEVSVPAVFASEAAELLDVTLGDKWKRKDP